MRLEHSFYLETDLLPGSWVLAPWWSKRGDRNDSRILKILRLCLEWKPILRRGTCNLRYSFYNFIIKNNLQ